MSNFIQETLENMFQSPRSGKFVSNPRGNFSNFMREMFQSPRSGKFVSNKFLTITLPREKSGFNPLDRGNLYLIIIIAALLGAAFSMFQSPRSGKFVSNLFF